MLRNAARYLNSRAVQIRLLPATSSTHLPDHAHCTDRRNAHQQSGSSGTEAAGPGPGSEELEDTFMQLYRRHNSSLKHLKGQVIGAKVFKTDRRFVFLDTGFNKYVKYAKKELHLSQLVSSKDGGLRTSPEDFRVGDVLQFVVEELETPYGDMQLAVERRIENDEVAGVWKLVKEAMRSNQPVMGRVLNGVNGGYSVGVAGIVAFCPFSQMSFLTASKVGMLQPFLVTSMNEAKRNIVLQDVSMLGKRRGPRGDLVSDQGRSPYRSAH